MLWYEKLSEMLNEQKVSEYDSYHRIELQIGGVSVLTWIDEDEDILTVWMDGKQVDIPIEAENYILSQWVAKRKFENSSSRSATTEKFKSLFG